MSRGVDDIYESNDTAILNIRDVDYRCIINGISKSKSINVLQNTGLIEKTGTLQNIKIYYHM